MAIPRIVLFYAFRPLADPDAVRLWQRDLCESLGLRGRILLSRHGINATLGGDVTALKTYVRKTREHAAFRDVDVKWSDGTGLDAEGRSLDFPRLVVKVRDEIVAFGVPDEVVVDEGGVVGGGTRLSPQELDDLVAARGDEVVLLDGRNAVEAQIGRLRGAVVPDVRHTSDFVRELDSGRWDELKGRPVVTYCTGGIRCEVLTSLMRSRGFEEVYQLDGGIVRYGEQRGDRGLWEGRLVVFDERMSIAFTDEAVHLAACHACGTPTSRLRNREDLPGRPLQPVCDAHA
ncbi:rhodanese-related sulfurtransferase [Terrabacter sp. NPDC000476]|uniref:oxygen-dependent tRNA uridine(34) hydroxylase TrhO n=1 Tax=Terrabacter sp. NPDC000476 TaxID=3154258 RepID=UPI00331B8A65